MLSPHAIIAGKYRVDRLIGSGGMGAVYAATNVVLEKPVALKVMGAEFRAQPEWVQRFFREGVAASRVRHPGVVQVFDAGEHEGAPWLAMELLEGESLGDRLRRELRLPPAELVAIVREVLSALAAVHAVGIVHRDLKPDNIFLARTAEGERAKVLDFGIAKEAAAVSSLTATGTIVGTAHYLAPEQARDSRSVDPRSDLYAIGVILFEGLSGHMPYEAQTVPELIAKMYTELPRSLRALAPHVPEGLARVVQACLARDPAARPQSAHELARALDPDPSTGPVQAVDASWHAFNVLPPPVSTRGPVRARRPTLWPWVVGAVVLLGLGALATVAMVGAGLWAVARGGAGTLSGSFGTVWASARDPMLVDVNDDGVEDAIGTVYDVTYEDMIAHLAAYDGNTGRLLWRSPALGTIDESTGAQAAIEEGTLLYGNAGGELLGYDPRTGDAPWRVRLGERIERWCAGAPGAVIVHAVDGRRVEVRLADGAMQPAATLPCGRVLVDQPSQRAPLSTRIAGPVEAIENAEFVGLDVEAAVRDEAGRTIALGTRTPGTAVPQLAVRHADGRGWILSVPSVDELRAEPESPPAAAIDADSAFVAYAMSDGTAHLTAIALQEGRRRWDRTLPESRFEVGAVVAGPRRVAVLQGGRLVMLDGASGDQLFTVGQ